MMQKHLALVTLVPLLLAGCSSKETPPPSGGAGAAPVEIKATAEAKATAAPRATAASEPTGPGLAVTKGRSTFLIDAPLEKIKGEAEEVKGSIALDAADLSKTRGEIFFRLSSLKTSTFNDAKKDASQSDHAKNWLQVGKDSKPEEVAKFEWVSFKVVSVEAAPGKLAEAKEEGGGRLIRGKVTGDFTLHGKTARKTLAFTATVKGPADKPTSVTIKTEAPFDVSMKEHEVMPRDEIGSLINGALGKIGKKIDDRIQVSLEVTAGT